MESFGSTASDSYPMREQKVYSQGQLDRLRGKPAGARLGPMDAENQFKGRWRKHPQGKSRRQACPSTLSGMQPEGRKFSVKWGEKASGLKPS